VLLFDNVYRVRIFCHIFAVLHLVQCVLVGNLLDLGGRAHHWENPEKPMNSNNSHLVYHSITETNAEQ